MTFPVPRAPKNRVVTPVSMLPTVEEISAGGVIVDFEKPSLPVAIIARVNRGGRVEWCLPKGHPEGVETNEDAAAREIEEETGIAGDVLASLGSIDYWFTVGGHRVHKTVHHFLLNATGGYLTTEKDPDHEAVDVAWVDINDLGRRLSFPNERRIAEIAREYIIHQLS
ncbi:MULTISPECIES: NUDIX hydrolase [unclassified Rothia (in: high G+C Gram-positive bacteria)]|uniref:NUDIX hydrolase n=1 Tax=unclassified Rothia (in: high G+C Gram-positive bacteria) TaxID=2689056 RepID=UPI00195ABC1B|nr:MULTISPECIES: NUDIX hydrolase [unclassified Rothia (in: high G+C Gram-positive bacteria)]MBM7051816.1 NUDIX hydrolase [Rothia sp. ZJ1223]QRZ61568.1 NUDIX hydrolase [Rothia sp. ZJ932]